MSMATVPFYVLHPHLLRDQAEYDAAVADVAALTAENPPLGVRRDRLDYLTVLVADYEARNP